MQAIFAMELVEQGFAFWLSWDMSVLELRPTNDPEGHHGPDMALSLSRNVPLRQMQVKAADFLQERATNYTLTTVRRWGRSVAELLERLTGKSVQTRCSHLSWWIP